MRGNDQKIVQFDKYCKKCKHYEKDENEEPCDECLSHPTNVWSHKPMKFEEKTERKKIKNKRKK